MNALLVITSGQTDVQLVRNGERVDFDKSHCASLHEKLASLDNWTFGDSNIPKAGDDKAVELPPNPVLCTPKLDAVLRWIDEKGIQITHAAILDTQRVERLEEPRSAGPVLARRMQEKCGVSANLITYLQDTERLEDTTEPRDAMIRRDVVERIDLGLHATITDANPEKIVMAATGGFGVVASLVEQIVRLYARPGTEVEILDVPDSRHTQTPFDIATTRMIAPRPHDSFEARRRALELIREGHLLGAWGAVKHLHSDPVERQWTKVIEWLYLWAASMPVPEECTIQFLKQGKMAPRAACRVEFALRAGDVPRAIHGTVAFLEAALWDHLNSHITERSDKGRRFRVCPQPGEGLVSNGKNDKKPFKKNLACADGVHWYEIWDGYESTKRLAKSYLEKPELEKLACAVSQEIRTLRNDVAHNEPTPAIMTTATAKTQSVNLWSAENTFLTQPLVEGALRELGVSNPESLCSDLIKEIEELLLTPLPRISPG